MEVQTDVHFLYTFCTLMYTNVEDGFEDFLKIFDEMGGN